MRRVPRRPCGIGMLCYIAGIFTAVVFPLWVLAAIEGALLLIFALTLLRM